MCYVVAVVLNIQCLEENNANRSFLVAVSKSIISLKIRFYEYGAVSLLPHFVYCTLVMAQLCISKCSMKCSVHLTTIDRTFKSFGFFPISMFDEIFGTFDRGFSMSY